MNDQTNPRQLIDSIVYLASLVSEPRSVDTTLDKLRIITARSPEPSTEDVQTLQTIQTELENYLTHKERLRSFTQESLQASVQQHLASSNPIHIVRKAALRQIVITIVICSVITALPAALSIMHGQVILAFLICTLFVGLALMFQSMKRDLVAQLHGVVNYLMAATIGTGLFALNFPVIASDSYLNKLQIFHHGGFLEAALPVYACYYLAFYLYAKQLDVPMRAVLRPTGIGIGAVVVAAIGLTVPHPVPVSDEGYFHLAVAGFAVSVYFSAVAAVLAFKTVSKTTARYSKTTLFLAIAMVLQTVGNAYLLFISFASGDFHVNDQKGQVLTAFLIMAALAFQYLAAYRLKTSLE
jgi:hypothetical protein